LRESLTTRTRASACWIAARRSGVRSSEPSSTYTNSQLAWSDAVTSTSRACVCSITSSSSKQGTTTETSTRQR
jgi:hypothetical protein